MNYPVTGFWPIDTVLAGLLFSALATGLGVLGLLALWAVKRTIDWLNKHELVLIALTFTCVVALVGVAVQYG